MSSEKLNRGNHIIPLRDYMNAKFDEGTRRRMYEGLSPDTQEMLKKVAHEDWYPTRMVSEMHSAIFNARGNPQQGYEDMIAGGAAVAEYSVNTFMRLLIKLMTPEMLAKKWPAIWLKSHNFGAMETELDPNDPRKLKLMLSDVEDYHYIGPTVMGFLSFSLKAMGKDTAKVDELDNPDKTRKNSRRYDFIITW
ncbi:MAG: hypothetical protein QM778_18725 [Myxococcales bacterium]